MKSDIAVIGLGTFGFELATQLAKQGHGVLAIDIDADKVNAIKDLVPVAVQADVTDEDVLRKLEIHTFDKVIFGMSTALESVILAITHMKNMNVKHIIGKANTRIKKEILLKIGADEVVLPEIATAIRLSEKIAMPNIIEKFKIDDTNSLIEVEVPKKFYNKNLKELDLRKKHKLNVVMLSRNGQTHIVNNPATSFEPNDKIFVIGDETTLHKVFSND